MKKILALILSLLMVFALGACGSKNSGSDDSATTPTETTGSYEIEWQNLPDSSIVGAWKPAEAQAVTDELILFTQDGTMRVACGTFVYDADITFGVDGYGNKSAYTESYYLYGQWTYEIEDGVLTVQYPTTDADTDVTTFEEKVFNLVDYTPITLVAKEDFVADEALVGKWTNSQYGDYYEFTEDGYCIYFCPTDTGVYVYDAEVKYTYTVDGNEITLYYYMANGGEEFSDSFVYSVDGTKLLIDGNDYYLNGEGEPEVTESDTEVYAY